jgi:polysaccharide biosynthesis/export protein
MTNRYLSLIILCLSGAACYSQSPVIANAPAAAAVLSPAAESKANTYVIGPADVLTVTVWKQPNLSGPLVVRPDGMISMPLLGDIAASGSTPLSLADLITTQLRKYFRDPSVSVELTQINSKKIYLLGEVQRPGPVDMSPGMTLLQAISSAGGPTEYANTKKMYVLRNEAGREEKVPVRYKDALKGRSDANVVLKSGDTIVIP